MLAVRRVKMRPFNRALAAFGSAGEKMQTLSGRAGVIAEDVTLLGLSGNVIFAGCGQVSRICVLLCYSKKLPGLKSSHYELLKDSNKKNRITYPSTQPSMARLLQKAGYVISCIREVGGAIAATLVIQYPHVAIVALLLQDTIMRYDCAMFSVSPPVLPIAAIQPLYNHSIMSPNNFAAVLPVAQGTITVGPVDYPTLPPGGVILRNTVVAFNPVDWKIARNGNRPIEYPAVLGYSYGGVVEAVDEAVSRVKKGDYVFTHNPKAGGFQRFSAADATFVGKVDEKSVEETAAVVLNLRTIIGAAVEAGLDRPKDTTTANPSNGKKALVYGGSSSLGALAIQYLVQAGYTVISTSSPANHALVSGFRAAVVVDHTKSADDVVAALKKHGPYDFAFDAISTAPATAINAAVLGAQSGDIVLYSVGPPPADVDIPKNVTRVVKGWPSSLAALDPSFDEWVFVKYIPEAVAAGTLKSVPLELIHGGLGAVDGALRKLEQGVSAQKLILYQWEDAPKSEL